MSNKIGDKISVSIFGQSHSEAIGCVIEGLPCGFCPDLNQVMDEMERRRGGKNRYSTKRAEADKPEIISGMVDGVCSGAPLTCIIKNADKRSTDYSELRDKPRPGHADYTAYVKTDGHNDIRGGGEFSGRLTAPLVFAGALCKQLLAKKGIKIGAHIEKIADIKDKRFDPINISEKDLSAKDFPTLDFDAGVKMQEKMIETANCGDSLGGVIECAAIGVPAGLGAPMFDGIENQIAKIIFGIPAVKGIEFGVGFGATDLLGSQNNDPYEIVNGEIKTKTNNCGGILGGITNGMPLIFRCAIKPTPSISKEQDTVSLSKMENTKLQIKGRHDPCIVPRAVVVVESAMAIALANLL